MHAGFVGANRTQMIQIVQHLTHIEQLKPLEVLAPPVEFEGEHYILLTPQLSAVSVRRLSDPVGSLAAFRTDIVAALNFAFTGF